LQTPIDDDCAMKRHDKTLYAILGTIFIISSLASVFFLYTGRNVAGLTLEVRVNDEIVDRIDLARERSERREKVFEISRDIGYNAFSIGKRGVKMISADCRGGDCLRMPSIGANGGVIVCLPHRMILRVVGSSYERGRIDGVSY
jgi:hypothetical protein